MPDEPRWLPIAAVIEHNRLESEATDEPHFLCDRGLLESALARPQNFFGFGEEDIVALAVALMAGVARAHAFEQGNKRTAFGALWHFLRLNGYDQPAKVWRVGWMWFGGSAGKPAELAGFRQGLKEFGQIEGQNLIVDDRFEEGRDDRIQPKSTTRISCRTGHTTRNSRATKNSRSTPTTTARPVTFRADSTPIGGPQVGRTLIRRFPTSA